MADQEPLLFTPGDKVSRLIDKMTPEWISHCGEYHANPFDEFTVSSVRPDGFIYLDEFKTELFHQGGFQ